MLRALVTTRLRWWQEVLLVLAGYFAYEVVQFSVTGSLRVARLHSHDVLVLEQTLGLDHEGVLNTWVAGSRWLALGSAPAGGGTRAAPAPREEKKVLRFIWVKIAEMDRRL